MSSSEPKYDMVVFGATSFVGQILTKYLQNCDLEGLKWAISGRSKSKLEKLRKELGESATELPIIVADASDEEALKNLCLQTKVVISTVGPYALYGEKLVKICCETGTDYCDLTGESHWVHQMISKYETLAQQNNAHIVHCCGFDSIPSDLGVFFLQQKSQEAFGMPCENIKMQVKKIRGGFSGGTVASIVNLVKEASKSSEMRKKLANPYLLCPSDHGFTKRQNETKSARFDQEMNCWVTPFIMASINTRIVHRSNALSEKAYGKEFEYDEAVKVPSRFKAKSMSLGLNSFMFLTAVPVSRWFLEKLVLPKPGEGPSPEEQEKGSFELLFFGTTKENQKIQVKVTGDRDPGYGSTAKMLGQAGISLAKKDVLQQIGGFWTPATLFGSLLVDRLSQHSGLTFEVVSSNI